MKYQPPINGDTEDEDRSYINGDRQAGIEGSIPSAESIEHPQREIIAVIEAAGLTPDSADLTQLLQAIPLLSSGNVGAFFWFVGVTPPNGALVLDGTVDLSRTTYAALYNHLNTEGFIVDEATKEDYQFGDGDGETTFSLADVSDDFIRACGVGRSVGTWQDEELKSHTHTASVRNSSGGSSTFGSGTTTTEGTATTNSTGGDETRPRNTALLPCIQYQ